MSGKLTLPVERTAAAGFITFSVAPKGYMKDSALQIAENPLENIRQVKTTEANAKTTLHKKGNTSFSMFFRILP